MRSIRCAFLLGLLVARLPAGELIFQGSDTLGAKMVPQLTEAYQAGRPDLRFEISAEGSSSAFAGLLNGRCDIGMSSRVAKPEEHKRFETQGLRLTEHTVCYDMIAVIVNAENPVESFAVKDLEKIFTGEVTNWENYGGKGTISVYTRNTSSGTYKSFQKLAMNGRDYGEKTQKMPGGGDVHLEVSRNRLGIGYSGLAWAHKKGIRPVKIDGIAPVVANAPKHPLSRKLYFYTVGETSKEAADFIKWTTTSAEAAKIIDRVGFISLYTVDQARKEAEKRKK